jgi:hypothetical protein
MKRAQQASQFADALVALLDNDERLLREELDLPRAVGVVVR